jgi:hypothetical protein
MVDVVSKSPSKPVELVIARAGSAETLTVTPKPVQEKDPVSGAEQTVGKIGAGVGAPPLHRRSARRSALGRNTLDREIRRRGL